MNAAGATVAIKKRPAASTVPPVDSPPSARLTLYVNSGSFSGRVARGSAFVLDIDDTDHAVHGQQLALFNTHAGGYCFQPIKIFEATTGRPVLSLLRPGKRPSGEEVEQILRDVI